MDREITAQQAILFKFEAKSSQIEEFTLVNDDILLDVNAPKEVLLGDKKVG